MVRSALVFLALVAFAAPASASEVTPLPLPGIFGNLAQQVGYQHGYGQPGPVGQPASGNQQKTGLEALTLGKLTGMPETPGEAIQAMQGAQGLLQPANVPGGETTCLNQWRQTMPQGSVTGQGSPFGGAWIPFGQGTAPAWNLLPNGVNYR